MPNNNRLDKSAMFAMRINPVVKEEAAELFAGFGLSLSEAITLFLHQSIIEGGLPFTVKRPVKKREAANNIQAELAEAE